MGYQKIWTLKNSDLRTNDYPSEKRDLISKGGFIFLHIMSSLLFSKAEFLEEDAVITKKLTGNIIIDIPARKNEFTKRKKWLFEKLDDEKLMEEYYALSKDILFQAANNYVEDTKKIKTSLFKNRGFDKDYLIPRIDAYFDKKTAQPETA